MSELSIRSEITGTVWKVLVEPGQKLAEGDILVILESMKMEIPVIAEDGGTVRDIKVKEGDAIDEGQVVAVLDV